MRLHPRHQRWNRSYDSPNAGLMSEQKPIAKVPDGVTRFYTTRQLAPNSKGFVGYETIWKPLQKEVPYKTPKKP